MTEVTKDQFYAAIGPLNVHPTPEGPWPYKSVFKTPSGRVMGWIQDGDHTKPSRYFTNLTTKGK